MMAEIFLKQVVFGEKERSQPVRPYISYLVLRPPAVPWEGGRAHESVSCRLQERVVIPHKCRQDSLMTHPAERDAGLFLGVGDRKGLAPGKAQRLR